MDWPAMHTSWKHFAPAQDGGAAAATGLTYSLLMAWWRSSGTSWSSAQQIGQHCPGRRTNFNGGMHWMSAQPMDEHAGASGPWSTLELPDAWRINSACSAAGIKLFLRNPAAMAKRIVARILLC